MERRLRILLASPAYWPAHAFGGPVVVARELVSRLVDAWEPRRGCDDDAGGRRRAARPPHEDRDGRRRARDVPRHAAPLPLDGDHAHAAARAPPPRAARRGARDGVPGPGHDGCGRVVPRTACPLRLRARRDVQAAPPQGAAQAGVRRDTGARGGVGREARDRLLAARAGRRRRLWRGCRARPRPRERLPEAPARRPAWIRSRESCPPALRWCSTSAGSPRRRGSSTCSRRRGGLPEIHVVLAGPDDRHGTMDAVRAALADSTTAGRVHVLPPTAGPPVRPLPSRGRVRPRLGRGELRARRGRGRRRRDTRDRLRPHRRRGVVPRRRGARRAVRRRGDRRRGLSRPRRAGAPGEPRRGRAVARPGARRGTRPSTGSCRSTRRRSSG